MVAKVAISLSLVLFISIQVYSQCYKSELVFVRNEFLEEKFELVDTVAYLDYNLKDRYVKLYFQDTLYHYNIKKTDQKKDQKRFTVNFKKTSDFILWNLTRKDDYIFVMQLDGFKYWFRDLKKVDRNIIKQKAAALAN